MRSGQDIMRSGQDIYDNLCDKLKGVVDVNATYDSDSLIDLFRNHQDFTLRDMLAWLFGGADFFGSDSDKESHVLAKMNEYIVANPIQGEDVLVLDAANQECGFKFYVRYGHGKTAQEKEQVKQDLCDLFHS